MFFVRIVGGFGKKTSTSVKVSKGKYHGSFFSFLMRQKASHTNYELLTFYKCSVKVHLFNCNIFILGENIRNEPKYDSFETINFNAGLVRF